jgi:hypothetical protein
MVAIASAASLSVRKVRVSKANGSRVWSMTWTDQPSSPSQIVR